ncbi:MAG: hypothetical protein PVH29_04015 [Candidatus Zixiibacteriota bacterium]|jgi:hypothetical protein
MRSLTYGFFILCAAVAAAQDTPPVTEPEPAPPTPAPAAPVQSTVYPAFDAGLRFDFYAEQNIFRAYEANPADFHLFKETFVAGDLGGDLSFGGFSYKKNDGSSGAGPTQPDKNAGLDVSYTAGLGGRALGAYRRDFWVIGGAVEYDRTAAALGYNGGAVTVDPLAGFDDGWTHLDLTSQRYGITAAGAAEFAPHVVGGSFSFLPEKLEGEYDFEFLPATGVEGYHSVEELWGRREVKEYRIRGGYSFRPDDRYDVGGTVGARILESGLDYYDAVTEEPPGSITSRGSSGSLDLKGTGITVGGNGRYELLSNLRVGGEVELQFIPNVTVDRRGETWDLVGPFGERSAENYRYAECGERHYKFGGGLAFYPGDRTTLAFDYGYDRFSLSAEVYDDDEERVDDVDIVAYHTFARLGIERWLTDEIAAKVGWEHNLFGYPRNVFFGGVAYKFDDDWFINYDYRGDQLTVNNISLFVPLGDVIRPASHRFTVARYF